MRFMRIGLLIIVLITAGCAAGASHEDAYVSQIISHYPELDGKSYTEDVVQRIVDGDTVELASGAKVRLIGVNTPEITNGKSEWFGLEAKQFTSDRLLDQPVLLFMDVSDTDRYGRLLRYVFVREEVEMFNELLIREGYANTMTVPPNVTYADRFVMLEQQARAAGQGLWGDEEQRVELSCEEPLIKGNINSNNEKIYHIPGSRYYESTIAEMMFCTIEEAQQAGFRAPKR